MEPAVPAGFNNSARSDMEPAVPAGQAEIRLYDAILFASFRFLTISSARANGTVS
jgi:hypothetical protein